MGIGQRVGRVGLANGGLDRELSAGARGGVVSEVERGGRGGVAGSGWRKAERRDFVTNVTI